MAYAVAQLCINAWSLSVGDDNSSRTGMQKCVCVGACEEAA